MKLCDMYHGSDCQPLAHTRDLITATPGLQSLLVIDVDARCIIESPENCQYLTLSYVWGSVPTLRLTSENKDFLSQAGSLLKIRSEVPRTIWNAIEFVAGIGERYLWVDSLCLDSSNTKELANGIAAMDLIYEASILNIIAASGSDANAGLPGLDDSNRLESQPREKIRPGRYLTVLHELDDHLTYSVYGQRGWT
jgi:hypothetical protein